MSSANLADVRLNGVSVPEAGLNAAIAGHYKVPVAMISGDDAAVKEAQALLGPIEGAIVKWSYGFHSARTLTPEASCDRIREAAKTAVGRRAQMKPYVLTTPVTLDVRFKSYRPVGGPLVPADRRAHRRPRDPLPRQGHDRDDPVPRVRHELRAGTDAVTVAFACAENCGLRPHRRAARRDAGSTARLFSAPRSGSRGANLLLSGRRLSRRERQDAAAEGMLDGSAPGLLGASDRRRGGQPRTYFSNSSAYWP